MAWRCRRKSDGSYHGEERRDSSTDRGEAAWVITKGEARAVLTFFGTATLAIIGLVGDRYRVAKATDQKPTEITQPRDVWQLQRDLAENTEHDKARAAVVDPVIRDLTQEVIPAVRTLTTGLNDLKVQTARGQAETNERFAQLTQSVNTLTAAILRDRNLDRDRRSAASPPGSGAGHTP